MSIRTIIEINHDYLHDLLKYPNDMERFLEALKQTQDYAENHAPNGIRVLRQRHHSDKITIKVE